MATFTWKAGTTADWNSSSDWGGTVPGTVPANKDVVNFVQIRVRAAKTTTYTVSIASGESFDVGTLKIGSVTGTHSTPALTITGSLLTDNLAYTTSVQANPITIEPGGVFDARVAITDASSLAETVTITGTTTTATMEFGSATASGFVPGLSNTNVTFSFTNNVGAASHGVIDYLSGFTTGATTSQKISNFNWGDGIIITGANFLTGDTAVLSGTTLMVKSGGTTLLTMDNVSAASGTTFKISSSGHEILAVCYARGTMIATPDGEKPVESLRAGKRVIILVDGEPVARPVKWLGRRRIELASHPRPETVAPIRIQHDAFADGIPHRDLVVSPDHAIFVDGRLICARQLVNGTTIRQETGWTAVDYYHVELDQHAILLAEGLTAESYIDTGNSGFFANSGEPLMLHPDLTDEAGYPTREAGSCAPFVWDAESVQPVWQHLADRAATLGLPVPAQATSTDAGLRVIAKGRTTKPIYDSAELAIFALPLGASDVRLVSRAARPTDVRPWLEDRRTLGVRVKHIVLRSADDVCEVPVDDPGLADGWWAVERDGLAMSRWTDGEAVVPLPAMRGNTLLEIHLAGAMTYVVAAEAGDQAERRAA